MKLRTITLVLAAAAVMTFGLAGSALAFHEGGVAYCEGCHTMHNSIGGVAADTSLSQFTAGPFLLKGNDPGSACLNCHNTRGEATDITKGATITASQLSRTPGGDYAWLKVGTTTDNVLSARGHNIVAADFGFGQDTRTMDTVSNYPRAQFFCSSCHDPHGKYRIDSTGAVSTSGAPIIGSGSTADNTNTILIPAAGEAVGVYRLLAGTGYSTKSAPSHSFTNQVPAAVAPSSYNRSENVAPTDGFPRQVHVAYGSGMSEWCANCHAAVHDPNDATANLRHPTGIALPNTIVNNYNSYVSTGIMTGSQASSFLSLVQFETGNTQAERQTLANLVTTETGPSAGAKVQCLSCHRAHASGFTSMMRWDPTVEIMVEEDAWMLNSRTLNGLDNISVQAAYYNRPTSDFGNYQRQLCNKCHVKD